MKTLSVLLTAMLIVPGVAQANPNNAALDAQIEAMMDQLVNGNPNPDTGETPVCFWVMRSWELIASVNDVLGTERLPLRCLADPQDTACAWRAAWISDAIDRIDSALPKLQRAAVGPGPEFEISNACLGVTPGYPNIAQQRIARALEELPPRLAQWKDQAESEFDRAMAQ
ncbi:MAG: hypothetical protein OXU70_05760 [Gammaproteobacteria bacterium]|nr:hypothetical protein [Gammaproteobacteria bacterium]